MRTNEEKRRIVEEALVPGTSVAAVARRHDVNTNLLFGWCRWHKHGLLERSRRACGGDSPRAGPICARAPMVWRASCSPSC